MDESELDGSELGTLSYWQRTYSHDITNFEKHGDPGEVWFGEDSMYRVVEWISKYNVDRNTAVVDLGCGNGYTLVELAREGFTDILGLDYCEEAITLAKKVTEEFPNIKFQVFDLTKDSVTDIGRKFGLIHDKGTYDAVSLNPEDPKHHRKRYIDTVEAMLEDNGMFVITSCNWTEQELIKHFAEKMRLKCVIPTPQFKFGGKTGSVVSSVVFVKK